MIGKHKTYHILEVALLVLLISSCDHKLPGSTDAVETRSQFVSSYLKPAFLDTTPGLVLTGPAEYYTQYGNYPRFGDVNGNGCEDLLVAGASRYNKCQGRLYLYYGGKDMNDKHDKIFTGEKTGDFFGEDAYLADVNGDGYEDLLVAGGLSFNDKFDILLEIRLSGVAKRSIWKMSAKKDLKNYETSDFNA